MKVGAQPTRPFMPNDTSAPPTNRYFSVGVRSTVSTASRISVSASLTLPAGVKSKLPSVRRVRRTTSTRFHASPMPIPLASAAMSRVELAP